MRPCQSRGHPGLRLHEFPEEGKKSPEGSADSEMKANEETATLGSMLALPLSTPSTSPQFQTSHHHHNLQTQQDPQGPGEALARFPTGHCHPLQLVTELNT